MSEAASTCDSLLSKVGIFRVTIKAHILQNYQSPEDKKDIFLLLNQKTQAAEL